MNCPYTDVCGGCPYRSEDIAQYREMKCARLSQTLERLQDKNYHLNAPIFIEDGKRRRAALTFRKQGQKVVFGFNGRESGKVADIANCAALGTKLNRCLPHIKDMLQELCKVTQQSKRGKKIVFSELLRGDVPICEADNGVDVVLEYDRTPNLEERMIISEYANRCDDIIRIAHRGSAFDTTSETIVQKVAPFVTMGNFRVMIPAGTFLQASKQSESAMGAMVTRYLHEVKGEVADLFCGVGTFSYYLTSDMPNRKICAVDASNSLLDGFRESANACQITNLEIKKQNLFKYPLDENELARFEGLVFDPPRAGAKEQCNIIAKSRKKPRIIAAVSCNPTTFVNDANRLWEGGYELKEITMVDQFVYSDHCEIVALFSLR
ncbi:MAG: class I SAM-dependent RNA methyltransferase [Alphaproteobacteria bacterium]|nr:class I SAM-dependent RNA methyltransferase [Alphaproteobacteria bacterium]MBQ9235269.1 class I SAM-dependent RNA methyltransferase [Alphaproteobacteria bacterium]